MEMNSVGPATRKLYTTAHDAFVVWARTRRIQSCTSHTKLKQVRFFNEELFAKDKNVARMALFGTIGCRGGVGDSGERPFAAAPLDRKTCSPCAGGVVRLPLLQFASPKRSDIAVQYQLARADFCLQSQNWSRDSSSVVGLGWHELWISAISTLTNDTILMLCGIGRVCFLTFVSMANSRTERT